MESTREIEIARFIGARLKRYRNLAGHGQREMGEAIGVSYQQIQKFERGVNRIHAVQLVMAAEYLGWPVSDFLPRDDAEADMTMEAAMATPFGARLMAAFIRISTDKGREAAVFLVEALATAGDAFPTGGRKSRR